MRSFLIIVCYVQQSEDLSSFKLISEFARPDT